MLRDDSLFPSFDILMFACFIFLTVCWNIFQIDAAMRIPLAWGIVLFCIELKAILKIKIVLIWLAWILYALCNSLYCGLPSTLADVSVWLFLPLFMLMTSAYCTIHNPVMMLRLMFFSMLICCMEMALRSELFMNFSLFNRISSANGVNANEIGIYLALLLPTGIALYYQNGKRFFPLLLLFIFLDMLMIFATASRTAFVLAFGGMTLIFLCTRQNILKKVIILSIISYILINAAGFFGEFLIFERLKNTEQELAETEIGDTFLGKHLGDRAVYFYHAPKIFLKHPLNGVGFNNYILYSPSEHVCHVEVMSQLAEEGILGFSLFLLFFYAIGNKIYQNRRQKASLLWGISVAFFITVCAVNFAFFTSYKYVFFMYLGYVLGCQYLLEKNAEENFSGTKNGISL